MRRAIVVAGTLFGAVVLAQVLDRDPVPPSAISVLWGATALVVALELTSLSTLRRFATQRRAAAAGSVALTAAGLVALAWAPAPRLSKMSAVMPPGPLWSDVESTEAPLPMVPAARQFMLTLRSTSHRENAGDCSIALREGDELTPRAPLQIGELISSPRVAVTPELRSLRDAVRAMERVQSFRQIHRAIPSSSEEQSLIRLYDSVLTQSWILARGRRTPAGSPPAPEPSICAYGVIDLGRQPLLGQFEDALDKIPAS